MRFVNIDSLEEGMVLGKTLYGIGGQILLAKGTSIQRTYIDKMRRLNLTAVYISDEFSEEIEINETILPETRNQIVNKTKSFFTIMANADTKTINKHMKEVNKQIDEIMDQVILNKSTMVNMIDLKSYDDYTFQHSVNVGVLSTVMGVALEFDNRRLKHLTTSALFHDIGKMFLDKNILLKPGKLTTDEFSHIKEHARLGYNFASYKLPFSSETLMGILMHHEKFNGSGYPLGKSKDEINEFAQIISICDVFDAITSNRVYHKAMLPSDAIEFIMANCNEHFSARIAEVFLRKIPAYPIGMSVELSDGRKGVVCENYEGMQLRPKIKLFNPSDGKQYINLSEDINNNITIVNIVH